MGHRAMRLRFLDMEPEEVFEAAKEGDMRCLEFKRLWHKALAAATATSIHLRGPGRFFLAGFNVRFVDMPMLKDYLQQMVKMSPLQSYSIEIIKDDQETRVIGAAVSAEQDRPVSSAYFWHCGQKWVPRPPTTIFLIGVPQARHGSPPRPYTLCSIWK